MKIRCLLLVLIMFTLGCRGLREGVNPGDAAPEVGGVDLAGAAHRLSEYRGRLVLLHFWASWCQPCIGELRELERLHQELRDKGFVVVAFAVRDDPVKVAALQKEHQLTFPILLDTEGQAARRYESYAFPESFVIGRNGEILLVPDPADGRLSARLIGPKDWAAPRFRRRVDDLLQGAS